MLNCYDTIKPARSAEGHYLHLIQLARCCCMLKEHFIQNGRWLVFSRTPFGLQAKGSGYIYLWCQNVGRATSLQDLLSIYWRAKLQWTPLSEWYRLYCWQSCKAEAQSCTHWFRLPNLFPKCARWVNIYRIAILLLLNPLGIWETMNSK